MVRRGETKTRTETAGYQEPKPPVLKIGRAAAPTARAEEDQQKPIDLSARDRAVRAAKIKRRGALKAINAFLLGK